MDPKHKPDVSNAGKPKEDTPTKEIEGVKVPVKDIIALNIFTKLNDAQDVKNSLQAFGKAVYDHKDEIYRATTISRLKNLMKEACYQSNCVGCSFRKEEVLSEACIENFFNFVSNKLQSKVMRHDLAWLPKLIEEEKFKTEKNFNFWKQLNCFLTTVNLGKQNKQKSGYALFGLFLHVLPAQKVIPVQIDSDFDFGNAEFKIADIVESFDYACFSKSEIKELARVNPNLLKLIIDGIQDDTILSLSFHIKNKSTLEFFLAFALKQILDKPLLMDSIKPQRLIEDQADKENLLRMYQMLIRLGVKTCDREVDSFISSNFKNEYDILKKELELAAEFNKKLKEFKTPEQAIENFLKQSDPENEVKMCVIEECKQARENLNDYKKELEALMQNQNMNQNTHFSSTHS